LAINDLKHSEAKCTDIRTGQALYTEIGDVSI